MVYLISDNSGYLKIGIAKNIEYRLAGLQIGNPRKLSVVKQIFFDNRTTDQMAEKAFHKEYSNYRVEFEGKKTEWFDANGVDELLKADSYEVADILRRQNIIIHPYAISTEDPELFGTSITALKKWLDSWTMTALYNAGYRTIPALERWVKEGIYKIPKIGTKREAEIKDALKNYKKWKELSNWD